MPVDDLLDYYKRELLYLRTQSEDFARRHPKVAARLALHGSESQDPHTERLIEATAFLAARVHRDLDQAAPEIAVALLENVCPLLVRPTPAMTVAKLALDPRQGKVTTGFQVPRHTALDALAEGAQVCHFRSAWDLTVWPLRVSAVALDASVGLRLTLASDVGTSLSELDIKTLRFHLCGDWTMTVPLYEWLVTSLQGISVGLPGGASYALPATAWREVGFAAEEAVLPTPSNAQPAYGLLREYFAFPRKFHFFDLDLPAGLPFAAGQCELLLRLRGAPRTLGVLRAQHFQLNCVPLINLFSQTSEPIVIDHRQHEYRLIADQQRDAVTEIFSIESVVGSHPSIERTVSIQNFSALDDERTVERGSRVFWSARRETRLQGEGTGTNVYLSFVDPGNVAGDLVEPIVYADLLCMNRGLAEQVPVGARLSVGRVSQTLRAESLYEPTAPRMPPLDSDMLWRLVSLLTLSHQSLVAGSDACRHLKTMLRLFASDSVRDAEQIGGIKSLTSRPVTTHVGVDAWRGYCRGVEVAVEFDADAFVGGSPLLMGAVLARFFAMHTTINSFVRLVARRGDETWKQWEPMAGRQRLL